MSISKMLVKGLSFFPQWTIKPIAFKYVAGENLFDAIEKVVTLNDNGIKATLDILGESATTKEKVEDYVDQYKELIGAIVQNNLQSGISIKPTALGLSFSYEYALEKFKEVVNTAKLNNIYVRIDMEDTPYTTQTIDLYNELRKDYSRVGIVLQAYLFRTEEDIKALTNTADIRLCKGIYIEPPELAIKGYHNINDNYLKLLKQIFETGTQVAIATHDNPLIDGSRKLVNDLSVPKNKYEFQMLYGVKTSVAYKLSKEGHNVRVYVPFGKDWHAYSMRRMYENPFIALHITKAFFVDIFTFLFKKDYKSK